MRAPRAARRAWSGRCPTEAHRETEGVDHYAEGGRESADSAVHFLALTAAQHEELAADGWSFEHRLVGECTRRLFRNGDPSVVDGRLVAFLEASSEEAPLWKNMHEDGELEDLEFHEVKTARLNYRLKLAQPRGGVFAEDVSEFSIDEHLLSGPNGSTARRGPGISEPPPDSKGTTALVAQRLAKEKVSLEKGGFY